MQRPSKSSAETEKEAKKLTIDMLKKKIECIRFCRVLLDARGDPRIRLCTETQPIEVVDILCRVATTSAEDVTFNQPPIEDYIAAMSYDMIVKSSKALFGKVSKGRLSMWQFLPMEGPWSSSRYYSNPVLTSKKMLTDTAALALGSKPVQTKLSWRQVTITRCG